MMICIGIKSGKISEIREEQGIYFMRFVSDEGNYDWLTFPKNSIQLQSLAKILKKTITSVEEWIGTRVKLFLGQELNCNKHAMVYGITIDENEDQFLVPEYIFRITDSTSTKEFYTQSEVCEILEYTEDRL